MRAKAVRFCCIIEAVILAFQSVAYATTYLPEVEARRQYELNPNPTTKAALDQAITEKRLFFIKIYVLPPIVIIVYIAIRSKRKK